MQVAASLERTVGCASEQRFQEDVSLKAKVQSRRTSNILIIIGSRRFYWQICKPCLVHGVGNLTPACSNFLISLMKDVVLQKTHLISLDVFDTARGNKNERPSINQNGCNLTTSGCAERGNSSYGCRTNQRLDSVTAIQESVTMRLMQRWTRPASRVYSCARYILRADGG